MSTTAETTNNKNTLQSREEHYRLLVYGYIRWNSNGFNILFPMELMKECFIWFYEISLKQLAYEMNDKWDKWDGETIHRVLAIQNDYLLKRPISGGTNPYCFGTQTFKTGISVWRFKIAKKECYWIGIVDANDAIKDSEDIQTSDNITNNFYFASLYGGRYRKDKNSDSTESNLLCFDNNGDVVCMIVDLNEKTISYSVNNSDLICGFKNIGETEYKIASSLQYNAEVQLVASIHFKT
eukprot:50420_1